MTNDVLICNTSPLLYLGRMGQINLLNQLFTPIYVPETVLLEFDAGRLLRADTINPREFSWLTPVVITTEFNVLPPNHLGAGERAAIAYAITKPNSTIALDDRQARLLAKQFNLKIIGTIGILIKAKQANLIPTIQPLLNALPQHGFRLSPTIYQEALKLAHEASL